VLIQADNREVMGFVTTYPCNNSTRSPLFSLIDYSKPLLWCTR